MMSDERWVKVSLCIRSKTLDADHIHQAIGVKPSRLGNRGELVSKRSPQAGVRDHALCIFESPLASSDTLQEHLDWLSNFLKTHGASLRSLAKACDFDVRIGFSSGSGQGGFVLDSAPLGDLAALGIALYVDLYPSEGDGAPD